MDFCLKTIKNTANTSKIVLDRLNNHNNETDLKALAVLLGGYNEFGRKIDLKTHRDNMIIFADLIEKVGNELA